MIVLFHKCGVYMEPNEKYTAYLCIGCGVWVLVENARDEIVEAKDLLTMIKEVAK